MPSAEAASAGPGTATASEMVKDVLAGDLPPDLPTVDELLARADKA